LKKYIEYIFKVLECLNKRNLYFKLKKCKFYRKKINFLKFVVKQYRIHINFESYKQLKNLLKTILVMQYY